MGETNTELPELKVFLTGSQVYGTPRPDSDIDIVLPPMDSEESKKIVKLLGGFPLKSGKINLILTNSREEFNVWKTSTDLLKTIAPVTREVAKGLIKPQLEVIENSNRTPSE